MRTSRHSTVNTGDVIGVKSIHGDVYAHAPGAGGYECRDATPAEVRQAQAEGKCRTEYMG